MIIVRTAWQKSSTSNSPGSSSVPKAIRFSEARLQAESSRNIRGAPVSGVDARAVRARVPRVEGGVELHPRVAAHARGLGDLAQHRRGLERFGRCALALDEPRLQRPFPRAACMNPSGTRTLLLGSGRRSTRRRRR
ncbi:MAG: hypothetical protein OXG04_09155 [Acidobacteria bacterium]|nr:hypothetical protein [Acidobacteriota bacterium]